MRLQRKEIAISISHPGYHEEISQADLPLPPADLLDLLEKARITDTLPDYEIIIEGCSRDYLNAPLDNQPLDIYDLNHLAEILADMEPETDDVFEGLVQMEGRHEPVPLNRLISLALAAPENPMVYGITTDELLGRFYVENDMLEMLDDIPLEMERFLDYAKIGRERRKLENGVFTESGYVPKTLTDEEIDSRYTRHTSAALLEALPAEAMCVEISRYDLENYIPGEKHIQAALPISTEEYQNVLEALDCREDELTVASRHCLIPSLQEYIEPFERIETLNALAVCLDGARYGGKLSVYKALLEATGCCTIKDAVDLGGRFDEYQLDRTFTSPSLYAKWVLEEEYGAEESQRLARNMDLDAYGKEAMAKDSVVATSYGNLSRLDHAPILTFAERAGIEEPGFTGRDTLAARFFERLDADYKTYKSMVCTMDATRMMDKSEEMTATRRVYEHLRNGNLSDGCMHDLMQYDSPLIAARDCWLEATHSRTDENEFHRALQEISEPEQQEQEQQMV